MEGPLIVAISAVMLGGLLLTLLVALRMYRTVPAGSALIVTTPQWTRVMRRGGVVLPGLHHAETLDLRTHSLELRLAGRDGVLCRDNIRADVVAVVYVAVNDTDEDVLQVVRELGCARASSGEALRELLAPKIEEALRTNLRERDFEDHLGPIEDLRDRTLETIGRDLGGLTIKDLALPRISPTPIEQLDPANILDAQGILKITRTAHEQRIAVAELQRRWGLEGPGAEAGR